VKPPSPEETVAVIAERLSLRIGEEAGWMRIEMERAGILGVLAERDRALLAEKDARIERLEAIVALFEEGRRLARHGDYSYSGAWAKIDEANAMAEALKR
jgi:hypothetical protein